LVSQNQNIHKASVKAIRFFWYFIHLDNHGEIILKRIKWYFRK